jgi:hypothetical protein
MVRSSADCNVLLLLASYMNVVLAVTASPKTMLQYGQMFGDYVEHRVEEGEAMEVARTLHPELSKCN